MKATLTIVRRNLLNYFYDPSNVFFSFLSVFILIGVYGVFLGTFQVQTVEDAVGDIAGVNWLVNSWLIAGLLTVSSFTVPLNILSNMIVDLEKRVFDDFLVAPIRRSSLFLGYLISAILIGLMMTLLTFFLGELVIVFLSDGEFLSLSAHLEIVGWILLANVSLSALSFMIITFVKSVASVNALNTILGTLIGFLAGIYVPFAAFSESVANIFKFNPAAHIVVGLRQVFMDPAIAFVFDGAPASVQETYMINYGVEMTWFSVSFTPLYIALYLVGLTVLFGLISIARMNAFKR